MMNSLESILLTVGIFGSLVLIVYILARYNYLLRKAAIDTGQITDRRSARITYLDLGCVVASIGVGLAVSAIFTGMDLSEDTMDLLVFGTILVFGGAGLISAFYVRQRLD